MYIEAIAGDTESLTGIKFAEQNLSLRTWRSITYEALTSNDRPDTLHYHAGQHVFNDASETDTLIIGYDGNVEIKNDLEINGALTVGGLPVGGGSSAWGAITGTLSDQTDLQTALNLKANTADLSIANWNTAYGWGDHALIGYLTGFTEVDPVFTASAAAGILAGDITNWNTAYGWGNHASAGYAASGHAHETYDRASSVLSGATVFSNIVVTDGIVSSTATRTLTAANIGAATTSHTHTGVYQPLDGDLTAIAALAGTSGFLKKTAANTWTLDTSTYLTGITGQSIKNLSDVYSSMAPAAGEVLTWDNVNSRWDSEPAASGPWTVTGSDIYYTTGDVGIGVAAPSNQLHVKSTTSNYPLLVETDFSFYAGIELRNKFTGVHAPKIMGFIDGLYLYAGGASSTAILNCQPTYLTSAVPLFIDEQAAAVADIAGKGQLWVKNTTPNELWFTDDAGTDVQLGTGGGGATDSLFLTEQASAQADVAGSGQFWVKNDTPNVPKFTDDVGTDFTIAVYSTGTFTPRLQDSSFSDAEGQSYFSQSGYYTKIGNLVHFTIYLQMNSTGTLSSPVYIVGLPFTCVNNGGMDYPVSVGDCGSLAITASEGVAAQVMGNTDRISLHVWDSTSGTTGMTAAEISTGGSLYISGTYPI